MSVDNAIRRFRRRERKGWRSVGKLTRAAEAESTFSAVTGEETPEPPVVIYEGPCQVRSESGGGDVQAGEQEVRVLGLTGKLPVDTGAQIDDLLEIISSTYDAGLVGRFFRISDVLWDDWQITRNVKLEEVTP